MAKDRTSKQRQEDEDRGKNDGKTFAELQQEQIRRNLGRKR